MRRLNEAACAEKRQLPAICAAKSWLISARSEPGQIRYALAHQLNLRHLLDAGPCFAVGVHAAKAMAATAIDAPSDEDLLKQARTEWEERTAGASYQCPFPPLVKLPFERKGKDRRNAGWQRLDVSSGSAESQQAGLNSQAFYSLRATVASLAMLQTEK